MSSQILVPVIAGADLRGKEGYAVYIDGADTERAKLCVDDELTTVLGILVNGPNDEGVAYVCVQGLCDAVAGGDVEPFDHLMVDDEGKLIAHTGASAVAFARYIAPVKDNSGTKSYPDSADTRTMQVLVTGQIRVNPAA